MAPALLTFLALSLAAAPSRPPRLTLFITVDALGTDLLLRSRPHLHKGIASLLNQGAFFPNARYQQAENVTAAGHATLSTGASPWRHGIVGNRIINRATNRLEPVFADASHPVLDAPLTVEDVSPDRLMAETLSDRLRLFTQQRGKAVAIASKARAAIAQGGRLGQAFWFNETMGRFVTGTYYAKFVPSWVQAFNERKLPDSYFSKDWTLLLPKSEYLGEDDRPFESNAFGLGRTFPHPLTGMRTAPGLESREALNVTPMMNEVLVEFAKAALDAEQLGRRDAPDLLWVSFSPVDRTYHLFGPYSWEMQDMLVRLDQSIAELLQAAERAAGGRSNLLVVLTADHGGAAIPEEWAAAGLQATRVHPNSLRDGLNKELKARFGVELVVGVEETDLYLNTKVINDRHLDGLAIRRAAAQWLSGQPSVAYAVAKDDLAAPLELGGYGQALRMGYYPERSGDVLFILKAFNVMTDEDTGTSHAQPYSYDNQVPLVFMGKGVKPGLYREEVHPVDVAPTLASLLQMGFPAQAEGKPLTQMMTTDR